MCDGVASVVTDTGPARVEDVLRGFRMGLVGPLPPPSGGMANQTEQLRALMAEAGASVTLVRTNADYRPAWVGEVRGIRAVFRLVPYLFALVRAARRVDLFHVMANSGWSWFLFAAPAIAVARATGTVVVVNYRGGEAESFMRRFAWCAKPFLRMAHRVVVPSEFLERVFCRQGIPVEIIPNIIDVERFGFMPPQSCRPAAPQLVTIRNLEPIYGNDVAVRAFARVRERFPGARLTIAGEGPEGQRLYTLARELGVGAAVELCGRLDRDGMARLLHDADVMVNASRVDNMPNAILEALSSGTPVVTTDAGGIPFIVKDGVTAMICPVDDDEALASRIQRVLTERELAQSLARSGRRKAEEYSWPRVRALWARCYAATSRSGTAS